MSAIRIDFHSTDAARFNLLRDQWRTVALGCALTRAGLRVAGVLPSFVNRDYGYAFPTDDDLGEAIGADKKTAKRGLASLHDLHLIDRLTRIEKNEKGIIVGKRRRIYLTLPTGPVQPVEPKGHSGGEPKGQLPKGQVAPKGQNSATEGTPGCPYILDSTPDGISAYESESLSKGTYTRVDPSVSSVPSVDVEVEEKKAAQPFVPSVVPAAPASSPAQEPNSYLSAKNGDAVGSEPSKENDPSVQAALSPVPSVRWQDWKHPKILQGRALSRKPFSAPRSVEAGQHFLRKHHVPESEWPKMLPNLMDGYLFEFDIEPWMDLL